MGRLRIAMLTNNYKPFVGGVPVSIDRLARGLRELGHEVYVFAPTYEGQSEEPYVIRYRSRPKKLKGQFIVPDIFDPIIWRTFEDMPFDLIHVHHPMLMGYAAYVLGKLRKIPIVYTYHTRYEQYLHYLKPYEILSTHVHKTSFTPMRLLENFLLENCSQRLLIAHNRLFMNQCDLIFAPSQSMKQYLEEVGVTTAIEVLPTGITEEDFTHDAKQTAETRRRYLQGKEFLFCTVSRLEPEKNLEFLLRGVKLLREQVGDCFRVLIIGDGSQRGELIRLAEDMDLSHNVEFCGRIAQDELRNYYHACDLFLFTSRSETQGIVLIEAMAAGLPVVAVSASGVDDVVWDGITGFRTKEDVHQWSVMVKYLMLNAGLRERIKRQVRDEARKYLASNIALRAEKCYQNIIGQLRLATGYEKRIG